MTARPFASYARIGVDDTRKVDFANEDWALRLNGEQFFIPGSYREFCEWFGFGLLFGFFLFYVPMRPLSESSHPNSLAQRSAELRAMLETGIEEDLFDYRPDGSKAIAERLVPFGAFENGHTVAWYVPCRPPSSESTELEIYLVASRYNGIFRVAASFDEFIDLCLDPVRARSVFGAAADLFDSRFRVSRTA